MLGIPLLSITQFSTENACFLIVSFCKQYLSHREPKQQCYNLQLSSGPRKSSAMHIAI